MPFLIVLAGCERQLGQNAHQDNIQLIRRPIYYHTPDGEKRPSEASVSSGIPQRPTTRYYCLVGTLNPPGVQPTYNYKAFNLNIPKGLLNKARKTGKPDRWVLIKFGDKRVTSRHEADPMAAGGASVRTVRCNVPPGPHVLELVRKQLLKFGPDSWIYNLQKQSKSNPQRSSNSCCTSPVVDNITTSNGLTPEISTISVTCVHYSSSTMCSPYPYNDSPVVCNTTYTCDDYVITVTGDGDGSGGSGGSEGSGGGSPTPGGDDGDPCHPSGGATSSKAPALIKDPVGFGTPDNPDGSPTLPAGCKVDTTKQDEDQTKDPDPCTNTKSDTLNNKTVQKKMEERWDESYGPEDDPFPDNERNETLTFVLRNEFGYSFKEVHSNDVSSCHINPGHVTVPPNAVAILHTHPYKDGEKVKDLSCLAHKGYNLEDHFGKYPTYDANFVSGPDHNLVSTGLTLFVMDKDGIHILKQSNPYKYQETINRCGYQANMSNHSRLIE